MEEPLPGETAFLITVFPVPGVSANADPHTYKLRTRVVHIWDYRRRQLNRSAMEEPLPGETAFLITVFPVPGVSANADPHTYKLRTRVVHIWDYRRRQLNRSAMEEPLPGETAFLITVFPVPGVSANADPHTYKLRTRVVHIWDYRRRQLNRSAMEEPLPGETAFLITVFPVPGVSANADPHTYKLRTRVVHIWDYRRRQLNRSAMEEPLPGETAFLITVFPVPGVSANADPHTYKLRTRVVHIWDYRRRQLNRSAMEEPLPGETAFLITVFPVPDTRMKSLENIILKQNRMLGKHERTIGVQNIHIEELTDMVTQHLHVVRNEGDMLLQDKSDRTKVVSKQNITFKNGTQFSRDRDVKGRVHNKRMILNGPEHSTESEKQSATNKVSFSAYLSHDLDNMAGNQTVVFDATVLNDGNHYNPQDGTFSCPVPGVYLFSFVVNTYKDIALWIKLVLNGVTQSNDVIWPHFTPSANMQGSNIVLLRLQKGDKVWVAVDEQNYGTSLHGGETFRATTFSGVLLYE